MVRERSIPASAGEPAGLLGDNQACLSVYPRVCGGTSVWSPCLHIDWTGSIPASAGEPDSHVDGLRLLPGGLSPRLRGNHSAIYVHGLKGRLGSIPASAGEPPDWSLHSTGERRSIPASAGEPNPKRVHGQRSNHGLSPRLRGNLVTGHLPAMSRRSIPASAGEPTASTPVALCHWPGGLSPRLRGNLGQGCHAPTTAETGSIPASAGEPYSEGAAPGPGSEVYPRVCGGTPAGNGDSLVYPRLWALISMGLSPRLRGNPGDRQEPASMELLTVWRSIPASAGEPLALRY